MDDVGVVGAGSEGLALAAHLAERGHTVRLRTRRPWAVDGVRRRGALRATGAVEGDFPIAEVTPDLAHLAGACRTIFVATVTGAYLAVAQALAPHLRAGHVIVLFSGKLCGSAEFAHALATNGAPAVDVVETDALFAARSNGDGGVGVLGMKRWNLVGGCDRDAVERNVDLLTELFPGLQRAASLIERGLTDFGAIAHPSIALANLAGIDRGEHRLFYAEGVSERTVVLVEQAERDFRAVAEAYGVVLTPMVEVLDRYYGADTRDLLTAMRSVEPYRRVAAPTSIQHRFLHEDVASTLVPLQALGRVADVPTPIIDATISVFSALAGRDFAADGRTLDQLGWAGLGQEEILRRIAC